MERRRGVLVLKSKTWAALPFLAAPAGVVVAADYLTVEEACRVLFPDARGFTPRALDEAALAAAPRRAGAPAWPAPPAVWTARGDEGLLGHVVVDRAIGKHEFITYAVGVSTDGVVQGVEILSYKESYGGEVRNARWRRQFAGRRRDPLPRFTVDIKNITGATLSCRHVTEGVRRVLALSESFRD